MTADFEISDSVLVRVYLGPRPRHGIQVLRGGSRFIVPGETNELGTREIKSDATESSYSGSFFAEIEASSKAEELEPGSEGSEIGELLLRQVESKRPEFQNIIDLIAGFLGLRFHRQFVLQQLGETPFACHGDRPFRRHEGPVWEILEPISLNENGIRLLKANRGSFSGLEEKHSQKLGSVFHWLLRAWRETDSIYEFVALFVPLEAAVSDVGLPNPRKEADKQKARAIRKLIKASGEEDREDLLEYFNRIAGRTMAPTLGEQFAAFAEAAKLPGWEGDIEAFERFKKMRNDLVHRGDTRVQHRLQVGNEELRTLSDLVERYVNLRLFGDTAVYQSRWRPDIRDGVSEASGNNRLETDG